MQSYPAVTTNSIVCHVPSTLHTPFHPTLQPHHTSISCLCSEDPVCLYCVHQKCNSQMQDFRTGTILKVLLKSRELKSIAFLLTRSFILSNISDQYSMIYLWKNVCSVLLSCHNYFFPLKSAINLCTLLSQTNRPIVAWISFTATPGPSLIQVQYLLEE